MVVKMTAKNYGKRMGELLKAKLLDELRDKSYYSLQLNGKLARLGVPVSGIDSIIIREPESSSPTARSELYNIDLLGANGQLIRRLFLQTYFTGMKNTGIFSSPISAVQEANDADKLGEFKHREGHMLFWNDIGLCAPYLFAVKRLVDKSGEFAVGLITDNWDGATHHLDILAINSRKETIDEQLSRPLVQDKLHLKGQLLEERNRLENLEKEILSSVLRTINDFASDGTDALKGAKNLDVNKMTLDYDQYLRKVLRYFNSAYRWHCRVSPDIKADMNELSKKFRDSIKVVLNRIVKPERFIYAQGDEGLHHYQYRYLIDRNGEDTLVSGVFDADHTRLSAIERSRAKALLAPYLGISYDDYRSFVEEANADLEERLKTRVDGSEAKNRLGYIKSGDPSVMLLHDLWAVYEGVCNIGRAAEDDSPNNIRSTLSRESRIVTYNNPIIFAKLKEHEHLPRIVSLGDYNSRINIRASTCILNERLKRLLESDGLHGAISSTDSELYTSLNTLQDMLVNFTLPFAYKQRELPFAG